MNGGFKIFIGLIAFLVLLTTLIGSLQNFMDQANRYTGLGTTCPEIFLEKRSHNTIRRGWTSQDRSSYCMEYQASKAEARQANEFRTNEVRPTGLFEEYYYYWEAVYTQIYNEEKDKVGFIIDSLYALKVRKNLDRNQFARAIVSWVQDIPYTLILDRKKCEERTDYYGPCVSGEAFGLLTPLEFLYSLKGDCDTRTLMLYTILKQFDYQPVILVSEVYEHSILALDIHASGDYIRHRGDKYYFWETTSYGWDAGMLPPSCSEIDHWNIALF